MLGVCLQVGFQEDLVSNSEIQSAGSNSNLSFPASCGVSDEVAPDTVQRSCKSFPRAVPAPALVSATAPSLLCRLVTQHLSLGGHRHQGIEVKLGICQAALWCDRRISACSPSPSCLPSAVLTAWLRPRGGTLRAEALLLLCESVLSTHRSDPAAHCCPRECN